MFQPAEEGGAGARRMIDDGLFEQFPMDAVYGMHNWPGSPTGTFGVVAGPDDGVQQRVPRHRQGKGAHAAQPHKGIDPVMIAVQIAQSWQTIITRNKNPLDTAVLSITQIHAGSATNVIPDEAQLVGTVRTFTTDVLDMIEARMGERGQAHGGRPSAPRSTSTSAAITHRWSTTPRRPPSRSR